MTTKKDVGHTKRLIFKDHICYLFFSLPGSIGLSDVPSPCDQGGGIKPERRSAPSVIQGLDLICVSRRARQSGFDGRRS